MLGLSEGAIRVTIHRLRQRFRQVVRDDIAATVAHEDEVDTEVRYLVEVLTA
jgi:RNA polymerase sigma-70 factor (ECF subfamily)